MEHVMQEKSTDEAPRIIRAEWTAYFIFSIFFVPLALLGTAVAQKNPDVGTIAFGVVFPLLILTAFLIWIASFKIELGSDHLSYQTLFSKAKTVRFADVRKLSVGVGIQSAKQQRGAGGIFRLEIYAADAVEPIAINMKPFSKRDLFSIVRTIAAANPNVELDKLSFALKQKTFAPVTRAGARIAWQIGLWIFLVFLAINLARAIF
jgi:hypothetical protein